MYKVSSRTARAVTQRNLVSNKTNKQTDKKKRKRKKKAGFLLWLANTGQTAGKWVAALYMSVSNFATKRTSNQESAGDDQISGNHGDDTKKNK